MVCGFIENVTHTQDSALTYGDIVEYAWVSHCSLLLAPVGRSLSGYETGTGAGATAATPLMPISLRSHDLVDAGAA